MHKTRNLQDGYMGSGKLIKRAIDKYGIQNFKKEILFVYDNEQEMKLKEKELVVISEQTYNLNEGGKGGFSYINRHGLNNGHRSKEVEEKRIKTLSNTLKKIYKQKSNLEFIRNISKKGLQTIKVKYPEGTFKGKSHSEDTKILIGTKAKVYQKGERNSQYGTCWVTNGKENKKIKKEDLYLWEEQGYYKGRITGE